MDQVTIRPSDVASWMLCPKRVQLKDQYQYPSYAMTRGSLLHARIEHFLIGDDIPFEPFATLEDIIERDIPGFEFDRLPGTGVDRMLDEMTVGMHTWVDQVAHQIPEAGKLIIEKKLTLELPSGHLVAGTPDARDPAFRYIFDWKTAKRAWKEDKALGELQPPAYTALSGWDTATFTFWVLDYSTMTWSPSTVYVNEQQVNAWIEIADQVAQSIAAGVYPAKPHGQGWKPRGWHCSPLYCSAWNVCDAKYLIADGDASSTANPEEEWE